MERIVSDDLEDLDVLDSIEKTACIDCGSLDWTASNITKDGQFHECNICHKWDKDLNSLVRVLHS